MRVAWAVLGFVVAATGCADKPALPPPMNSPATVPAGPAAVVWFFVLHDCPISNSYAPEIGRISREYAARGVASYVVYVDEGVERAKLWAHHKEYGYPCPPVADSDRKLVRRFGLEVTPEAVVVGADGHVKYSGRIDDLYAELGKKRIAPTVRDLRDALDAVVEGRPVANPRVPAVGCTIEYPTAE